MNAPTIQQAKQLSYDLRADYGVIVLAFGRIGDRPEMRIAGASFGQTREKCSRLGRTLDRIIEAINQGEIEVG